MAQEFMEDNPPIVGWVLVLLECLSFVAVDERADFHFIALRAHPVGNDDVFEAALLADVIIL